MKYNYVFFNSTDNDWKKTDDGYFSICAKDLKRNKQIHIVDFPLDYAPWPIRFLYKVHNSKKLNKIIPLPFQSLWYPFWFSKTFSDEKPICYIVLDSYNSVEYIRYLKVRNPNSRIVKVYRDLLCNWYKSNPSFTEEICKELFDLRFMYDEHDAKKYNGIAFSEFESKVDVPLAKEYPLSDIFFAGEAKDRLSRLMEAYKIFTDAGLKCFYYLTRVPPKDRKALPGVVYADKQMTYREMLYHTVNSRCVLEINQNGAVGYTSRFLEAVMYNKKLITNNVAIRTTRFYKPQFIQCVDEVSEIQPEFVKADVGEVDYHYNNEFSPIHLIEQIDAELIKLDAKEGRL